MRIPRRSSLRAGSLPMVLVFALAVLAGACGSADSTAAEGAAPADATTPSSSDSGRSDEPEQPADADADAFADAEAEPAEAADTATPEQAPSSDDGSSGGPSIAPAGAVDPEAAAEAARANVDQLERDDNVLFTQLLNVADGTPVSISDAVDGDRPVLLWFWAPH